MEVPVLTGIYSEETHLPQPLRISLTVDLTCPERFDPGYAAGGVEKLSRSETCGDRPRCRRACISR